MSVAPLTTLVSRPRTRRAAPRVKTGCITCKIRRVKCGEEKPCCLRCISTGRKCDGYVPTSTHTSNNQITFSVARSTPPAQLVPAFRSVGENARYLEFYYHCAGPRIGDNFDREFWSQLSMQMAQSEPCIHHALIALGYLNKSESGSLKDARTSLASVSGQQTFLIHYNKAIKLLAEKFSTPWHTPEVGLVSCLVFVCIEFLRGNYTTAFLHFNNGLKMISTARKSGFKSSRNEHGCDIIEDTIVPMFERLLFTGLAYGVPTELALSLSSSPVVFRRTPFSSLVESQLAMYDLRNKSMLLLRHMGENFQPAAPTTPKLQNQKAILEALEAWLSATEELESNMKLSSDDGITIHSLKACYHCLYIFVASITDANQTECDRHILRFKSVVKHCRFVVEAIERKSSGSPAARFTFETSVIPCLHLVASRCRCPVTRREAVTLLERRIPREGLWDAQQQALVSRRLIEIEEREIDPATGWPTEKARIMSTVIRGDMDGNGRFAVYFATQIWGEGRGEAPLPDEKSMVGEMWREWFHL